MANNKRYQISYNGRSIEISRANSSTLVYRVPYQNIKEGQSKKLWVDLTVSRISA